MFTLIIFLLCVATTASDIFNYEPFLHLMTGLVSDVFQNREYPQLSVVDDVLYIYGGTVGGKELNDLWKMDLAGDGTLIHVGGVANTDARSSFTGDKTQPSLATESFPSPRRKPHLVPRLDKLLLLGGYDDNTWIEEIWEFDPASNTFALIHNPTEDDTEAARLKDVAFQCTFERNGRVVIIDSPRDAGEATWNAFEIDQSLQRLTIPELLVT